jgi:hypothetical protein
VPSCVGLVNDGVRASVDATLKLVSAQTVEPVACSALELRGVSFPKQVSQPYERHADQSLPQTQARPSPAVPARTNAVLSDCVTDWACIDARQPDSTRLAHANVCTTTRLAAGTSAPGLGAQEIHGAPSCSMRSTTVYPSFSYGDDETKKREFGESSTSPSCTTVPRGIRRVIRPRRLRLSAHGYLREERVRVDVAPRADCDLEDHAGDSVGEVLGGGKVRRRARERAPLHGSPALVLALDDALVGEPVSAHEYSQRRAHASPRRGPTSARRQTDSEGHSACTCDDSTAPRWKGGCVGRAGVPAEDVASDVRQPAERAQQVVHVRAPSAHHRRALLRRPTAAAMRTRSEYCESNSERTTAYSLGYVDGAVRAAVRVDAGGRCGATAAGTRSTLSVLYYMGGTQEAPQAVL